MPDNQTARSLSASLLDTNTNNCGHDQEKIIKFAQRKAITRQLATGLLQVQHLSSYKRMHNCAEVMCKQDDIIVSRFLCQHRICSVCSSHRSQKYYLQYKDSLTSIGNDWYFVTLTIVNMAKDHLRPSVKDMNKTLRSIFDSGNKKNRRKTGKAFYHGIRAVESTHNEQADTYHPHFHLLVHGEEQANTLHDQWLAKYPSSSIKGQDVKKVTPEDFDRQLREIFKYSIKGADANTPLEAVHVMVQAFTGLRSIQPFGSVKAKKLDQIQETPDAVTGDKVKFDPDKPSVLFRWWNMNWYDPNGKPLYDEKRYQFSRKAVNTLASVTKSTLKVVSMPQAKYGRLRSS